MPRLRRVIAVSSLVGVALLSGCASARSQAARPADPVPVAAARACPGSGSSAGVRSAVAAFRAVAARESIGGRPFSISTVLTSAGAAERHLFGSANRSASCDLPDVPAVAMVAVGRFDGGDEPHPPGVVPAPATYLTRVAARDDGGVMDQGLGDTDPGLSALGEPVAVAAP